MKTILNKILNFYKNIFSSSSDVSSKRFNGTLCIHSIVIIVVICAIFGLNVSDNIKDLMTALLACGSALLGVGAFEAYFKNKKNE